MADQKAAVAFMEDINVTVARVSGSRQQSSHAQRYEESRKVFPYSVEGKQFYMASRKDDIVVF